MAKVWNRIKEAGDFVSPIRNLFWASSLTIGAVVMIWSCARDWFFPVFAFANVGALYLWVMFHILYTVATKKLGETAADTKTDSPGLHKLSLKEACQLFGAPASTKISNGAITFAGEAFAHLKFKYLLSGSSVAWGYSIRSKWYQSINASVDNYEWRCILGHWWNQGLCVQRIDPQGKCQELLPRKDGPKVTDPTKWNVVSATIEGRRIRFKCNDALLWEGDLDPPRATFYAVRPTLAADQPGDYEFKDFWIYQLEGRPKKDR